MIGVIYDKNATVYLLFELVSGASATSNWPFLILAMKTCIGILNSFQIHLAWKL